MAQERIGDRVKRLRVSKGLSQRDIAGAGCSYAYVSRIEAHSRVPSMKALRHLASVLDTTPEFLETGHDAVKLEGMLMIGEHDIYMARTNGDGETHVDSMHALIVRHFGQDDSDDDVQNLGVFRVTLEALEDDDE